MGERGRPARVYLDQNYWIGLSQAMTGVSRDERFAHLLVEATRVVDEHRAVFVLSRINYEENWRRGRFEDRRNVASLMGALTKFHTIASPERVIDAEIEAAVAGHLAGHVPSEPEVFGYGVAHAVGGEPLADMREVASLLSRVDHTRVPGLEQAVLEFLEVGAIAGPPGDYDDVGIERPGRGHNHAYVRERERIRAALPTMGRGGTRNEAHRLTGATEVVELLDRVEGAARRRGTTTGSLFAGGRPAIEAFLDALPMGAIVRALHESSLRSDRAWEPNDHNDVLGLSLGAAYCDIVAGERHWVDKLRASRAPVRAQAVVAKPDQLTEILAAL